MDMPIEQLLSPIIKNRQNGNTPALLKDSNDIIVIEKIKQQKYDVLSGKISPAEVDLVRPEIVDSWLRSYRDGLDLFKIHKAPTLNSHDFKALLKENDLLIRIADSYIRQLKNMLYNIDCIIVLTDAKGIILRVLEGKNNRINEENYMRPGAIWTEKTVGTCSHSLCLLLESPIQICGPEHYCESFNYTTVSSAPIFDPNHNLLGTLSIASADFYNQNEHTLGFAVSMAWAIQNELRAAGNDEFFYATLESYQEGVITINKNGYITKANKLALNYFSFNDSELQGSKIEDVLGYQPAINAVLETGKPVLDAQIYILKTGNLKLELRSVQPVKNKDGLIIGCVINIVKSNKPKKVINQYKNEETRFTFNDIIATSPLMIRTIEMTKKFAQINTNILLEGESGTGKELFAQAIHNEKRPEGPFIAVNCAAIPSNLIESELFGYEGGAFTGAERSGRLGKIELANGGTLFLDEIGDMPAELQPVLLRVLEERKIMRIGGSKYIPIDFNLVAATNKDLLEMVSNNEFREDLYYRLAVFKASIPPLRERGPDIIRLAKNFINVTAEKLQIEVPYLGENASNVLIRYHWPGNVRQLENAMFYAVNMAQEGIIQIDDLPTEIKGFYHSEHSMDENKIPGGQVKADANLSIREMEKIAIIKALQQTKNNVSEAAKILGFSKTTMYRKIKEYNIDAPVRIKNC